MILAISVTVHLDRALLPAVGRSCTIATQPSCMSLEHCVRPFCVVLGALCRPCRRQTKKRETQSTVNKTLCIPKSSFICTLQGIQHQRVAILDEIERGAEATPSSNIQPGQLETVSSSLRTSMPYSWGNRSEGCFGLLSCIVDFLRWE